MDNTKAHEKYFPKNLNSGLRTNSVTAVTLIEQAAWLGLLRKKKNCIGKNATYLRQEKQVKPNARVTTSESARTTFGHLNLKTKTLLLYLTILAFIFITRKNS